MRVDLGLTPTVRTELQQSLNIIINAAAHVNLKTDLESAVRTNVTGAHLLLMLAEECKNIEVFCHVSTCYVNADRTGYVEERLYQGQVNWLDEYKKSLTVSKRDIKTSGIKSIIG